MAIRGEIQNKQLSIHTGPAFLQTDTSLFIIIVFDIKHGEDILKLRVFTDSAALKAIKNYSSILLKT